MTPKPNALQGRMARCRESRTHRRHAGGIQGGSRSEPPDDSSKTGRQSQWQVITIARESSGVRQSDAEAWGSRHSWCSRWLRTSRLSSVLNAAMVSSCWAPWRDRTSAARSPSGRRGRAGRRGGACGLADWLGDAGGFWGGGKHCQYLCDCGLHEDAGDDSAIDSGVVLHASVLAEAVAAP